MACCYQYIKRWIKQRYRAKRLLWGGLATGIEPLVRQLTLALKITINVTAMESISTSQNQSSQNDTVAIREDFR
jgi:hypoxanthine-guanine phosphoribosyltransferase